MHRLPIATFLMFFFWNCNAPQSPAGQQASTPQAPTGAPVATLQLGAERFGEYLPMLKGKQVGMVVNQTSVVFENNHLVDTLLGMGVEVKKIFAPEHGFRGKADAGALIKDGTDVKTGLPIISIYGKNKKPSAEQLADLDLVIFDIQDVGARFYTYISSMHYVMEACAEQGKQVLVLDRPNPNDHYIDGPIRQEGFDSFVGMHPIPVVHGLTVGELAQMINGEGWLEGGLRCELTVIPLSGYQHGDPYFLPVPPSPNLPNAQAIAWYPSLCLFEATQMSIGRGTPFPFQVVGYPDPDLGNFTFTPKSTPGAAMHPKLENQLCYGLDLRDDTAPDAFSLRLLLDYYQRSGKGEDFIDRKSFFDLLAGTDELRKQIGAGLDEAAIRESWQEGLMQYKAMRKRYLLYPDFE